MDAVRYYFIRVGGGVGRLPLAITFALSAQNRNAQRRLITERAGESETKVYADGAENPPAPPPLPP